MNKYLKSIEILLEYLRFTLYIASIKSVISITRIFGSALFLMYNHNEICDLPTNFLLILLIIHHIQYEYVL